MRVTVRKLTNSEPEDHHLEISGAASVFELRELIYVECEVDGCQELFYGGKQRGGDPLPPDDNELQLPVPWDALIDQGRIDNPLIPNEHGHGADPYRQPLINYYFRTLHRNQNN
ncbi:unnamed protein product [Acanthoscelides obtectus]|uniref:Ubiquitin-like domain-containing protein n=1 Tax=Acanthoscelides obtectus TaxID=200917 RepID=A0A9P0VR54_ACAOB|nr:unnamed protein product [Acanthoscelides obtectus]CAK1623381.1 hypothetical protein AOBTE_LOCUS1968 [Acanthoscelides obtectus]